MSLGWSRLKEIRECIPASQLGVALDRPLSAMPLVGESPQSIARFDLRDWFQVGPQQYIMVVRGEYRCCAWAASDGALAFILANDAFFDDGATSIPPPEVLPDGISFHRDALVRLARGSEEAVIDIDFYSQRRISIGRHTFFYRHVAPAVGEAPVCVRIIPRMGTPIEAQQARCSEPGDDALGDARRSVAPGR
jgi:hypothetical protein